MSYLSTLKSLNQCKAHLQTYPCPININFLWNFGFLLALSFLFQIITGFWLAIHYTADITTAFYSVQHIVRDVGAGWCFRYLHATGASMVFCVTYLHILRALSVNSAFYLPTTWFSGLILFLLAIVTAFLGYVLPWGQMSFWGATVITNLLSPVPGLVSWICGGFLVENPTLKRFFVLHFALPFICLILVFIHIFYLHLHGSSNPLGYETSLKVPFFPNIFYLDVKGFNSLAIVLLSQSAWGFIPLSHPDNSCRVDRFVTPLQIVPEWYFLPFYSLLKCIPHKTAGVLLLLASIQILFLLSEGRNFTTLLLLKNSFGQRSFTSWNSWFNYSFYALLWIGAQLPQETFVMYGRIFIVSYFISAILMLGITNSVDREHLYTFIVEKRVLFQLYK